MSFTKTDVGLVIEVVSQNDGNPPAKDLMILQADEKTCANFTYGIFPTKLTVLLVAVKNKFKGLKKVGEVGVSDIVEVNVLGLILPAGTRQNYNKLLTYSTLPFVYICNNDLGKDGVTVPLFEFPGTGTGLTGSKVITLNRDSGNFLLDDRSESLDASTCTAVKIAEKDFTPLLTRYNNEFISSGVDAGNIFTQIGNGCWATRTYLSKNILYADVLKAISERWFISSGKTKDYNIGASLYLRNNLGQTSSYKSLATSLNIKSVNKAAHAEVRLALVLDFLSAYKITPSVSLVGTPLSAMSILIGSTSLLLDNAVKPSSGSAKLGLFSSLLPCYMCLGNVESTVGGYIKSINGQAVGMNATFEGVTQTALIADTEYYDVDSTIEYRDIDIYKKSTSTSGSDTLIASVGQIKVSEPLVSNVRLTLATDSTVTPYPMSVSDAGNSTLGVGLQNPQSMQRYDLAAAALQLVHGKSANLVIDDTAASSSGRRR